MDERKVDGHRVGCDGYAEITERIVGNGCANELRGSRIKDGVGRVQNSVEARARHVSVARDVLDLAVAETSIVTPAPVEELVPFEAERGKKCIGLVIPKAIAKFDETGARAAGDDLLKGVEGIERAD